MCQDLTGIGGGRALKELPDQGGEIECQVTVMQRVYLCKVLKQDNKCLEAVSHGLSFLRRGDIIPSMGVFQSRGSSSNLIPFCSQSSLLLTTPGWGLFLMFVFIDPSFGSQRSLHLRRT